MTLHEAIEKLLWQTRRPMTARDIVIGLNSNKWYFEGDKSQIKTSQITARVDNHHELFEIDRSTSPLKVKLIVRPIPKKEKLVFSKSVISTKAIKYGYLLIIIYLRVNNYYLAQFKHINALFRLRGLGLLYLIF